ncbi:MAG: hypothetical protein ACYCUD_09110 [Candidatus Dormibacteria bacterium]
MLVDLLVAAAVASLLSTVVMILPGIAQTDAVLRIPLEMALLAGSGLLTAYVARDPATAAMAGLVLLAATAASAPLLPGWSGLARQEFGSAALSFLLYLAYSFTVTVYQAVILHVIWVVLLGSLLIVVAEFAAIGPALQPIGAHHGWLRGWLALLPVGSGSHELMPGSSSSSEADMATFTRRLRRLAERSPYMRAAKL